MAQKQTKAVEPGQAKAKTDSKSNGNNRSATGDELLEALAAEAFEPQQPQSTALRALRDIVIVAALLGGGVYYYYGYITVKEKTTNLSRTALDFLERDDIRSLKKAEAQFQEIVALDDDHPIGLSGLAETYVHMTRHGVNKLPEAESFLAKAVAAEAKNSERFATAAYIKVMKGDAAGAEADLKALFEQEVYAPKLGHAYGLALLEQGKYLEANQKIRQAIETDFNAVRFMLSLGEAAHRQGRERAAIKSIGDALGRTMSPDHAIAQGWLAALRAKNYGNLQKSTQLVADLGKRDDLTPVAEAYKAWAEGELNLALQNADVALEKAAEAEKKLGRPFAPFLDLKARAHAAKGQTAEAIAAYEAGIAATPKYRGLRWDLAKLKSRLKDDSALDLVAALEKDEPGTVGPEYEVFRGDHYLRQGKLEEAKAAYTKAADLGSDAEILLGIARVTFEEERKKGTKADIDAVGTAFEEGFSARRVFPELNEAMGDVNLWNFQVGAADKAFQDAEDQYKKLKRPVGDLVQFFDRVIATFAKADDKQIKKEAEKATEDWKKRKADYLASVLAGTN